MNDNITLVAQTPKSFDYYTNPGSITLAFVKSTDIQVYPCGRRRSIGISKDQNTYYIPFDPEARINTEANNTRYTSLNGYEQTYIYSWTDEELVLIIAGYFFRIPKISPAQIAETIGIGVESTDVKLYANIVLEESPIFQNAALQYNTYILRNQPCTNLKDVALNELDRIINEEKGSEDLTNYYFSGLSFTSVPLTDPNANTLTVRSEAVLQEQDTLKEHIISLCIAVRESSDWKVCEKAKLPKIEHGDTQDSAKVTNFIAETISAKTIDAETINTETVNTKTINTETINTSEVSINGKKLSEQITSAKVSAEEVSAEEVVSNTGQFSNNVKAKQFVQNNIPVAGIQLKSTGAKYRLEFSFASTSE